MSRRSANPPSEGQVPTLRSPRYSQSLERGLAILACFTGERHTLGIAELADMLGMSPSTTHRYVITLAALGYVEQGASLNRKYRLGLRVTDLGLSALNSVGLRDHAREPLEELRRRSSHTVNLAVLDGPNILYLERVRSYRREQPLIDLGLHLGSRLPAYCTAMGKVLLAHLPETEVEEAIHAMTLARRGPNSITSKRALCAELERIRENEGFAVNDQELTEGLHSIAAPVRSKDGTVVGAVNLAAHTSMISLRLLVEMLGTQLVETADAISTRLSQARKGELVSGGGHG
jgi:IclR family transcriptional regulator, pca regulon regulatory protein